MSDIPTNSLKQARPPSHAQPDATPPKLVFYVPEVGERVFAGFGELGPTVVTVDAETQATLATLCHAVAAVLASAKRKELGS